MLLLLKDTLNPVKKIVPETMSLEMKEREASAVMTTADMSGIELDSWLQDDTEPGKGMVWRVKSINYNYPNDTPKITLEHVISMLKDRIIWGKVTPATITGNDSAETCTAMEAIRYILGGQVDWVLGAFDYVNVYGAYKFDGDTLYDALESVCDTLPDCWWSYDVSRYPFRLNITRRDDDPATELRPGRNIRTITRNIDKSGMYTRFYPVGYDDLELPEQYVQKNVNLYGVICKTETNTMLDTEAELRAWANERLHDHCEPVVTVTVEGLELSAATGESLDRLWLGRVARIPLREFNTTFLERIVGLSWTDKVKNPEAVKITLSNAREDVATIIADIIKSSGKSSRTSTKQSKEDHAWFEDTDEHVGMCAKGIIGTDAQGNPNWYLLSKIIVDGTGIHQTVEEIQNENVIRDTKIDQNSERILLEANARAAGDEELQGKITVQADRIGLEVTERKNGDEQLSGRIIVEKNRITQEVTDRTNADSTLSGRITTEAGRITAEVSRAQGAEAVMSGRLTITENAITQEVTDRTNADNGLSGRITVNANKVGMVVGTTGSGTDYIKSAEICVAINEDNSTNARIDADKVYIGNTKSTTVINGKLSTEDLSSEISKLNYVATKSLSAKYFYLYDSPAEATTSVNVASTALRTAALTLVGNTYYLHLYAIDGTECVSTRENAMSFSRATALSGVWNSGTLTVSASPQGNSIRFGIFDLTSQDISWSGRTATLTVYANVDGGETKYDTGKRLTVTAPIQTQTYSHSWNNGTCTVTGNPSNSTTTIGIYDLRNQDVVWNGATATIAVYANKDGGENRSDTGKRLTVTASITDVSLWEGSTKLSGSKSIWGATNITAWCKVNGTWVQGDTIAFSHGGTGYQMFRGYNTNDQPYYGKLYKSDGTALTSDSYYWYGCAYNIGAASLASFYMYY